MPITNTLGLNADTDKKLFCAIFIEIIRLLRYSMSKTLALELQL